MAAGDLTALLVARVRTLLDEASAGFFSANEVYYALTDAQREIIIFALSVYKAKIRVNPDEPLPEVLRNSIGTPATGTGTATLPTGFLHALSIYITASGIPVFIRSDGRGKAASKANTYLASSATQPYCSITATQIVFETSVAWTMEYLQLPASDLDATHDPALSAAAYNAMVYYAAGFLLAKDGDPLAQQMSQQHLNNFMKELQTLSI